MADQHRTHPLLRINCAPMLTLWAAVVAERLGYRGDEALTLGRAGAGLNASAKGKARGLFTPTPSEGRAPRGQETWRVEFRHRAVPVTHTDTGLQAISKAKPMDPARVQRSLQSKYGEALHDAYEAMKRLTTSRPPGSLSLQALRQLAKAGEAR